MDINENTWAPSLIEAYPSTCAAFQVLGICCPAAVTGTIGEICRQYCVDQESFIEALKIKADEI